MWVANRADGTVTELRASDGAVLGTFSTPPDPYGIAFDGKYMWVSGNIEIYVLRASDGAVVGSGRLPTTQTGGVAFDGAYVWMAEYDANGLVKF
jgi:hypothetical protein